MVDVEWKMLLSAFGMGLLASCPIIWCFLFSSLFSFAVYPTWQSYLYVWSMPFFQVLAIFCVLRISSKHLYWFCIFNQCASFFCLLCFSKNWAPNISLPVLFTINAPVLFIWLIASFDVVYLCPEIYHRYFEMGFFFSLLLHYVIVQSEMYLTNVAFVPFFAFLCIGLSAFMFTKNHDLYLAGKMRCKPIFHTRSKPYIVYNVFQILDIVGIELFILFILNIAMIAICISLSLFTNVFLGMHNYVYIFYVGNFCCGSLMLFRGVLMVYVYSILGAVLTTVLIVYSSSFPGTLATCLLTLLFICYFHANSSMYYVIRRKLNRSITTPRLILNIILLTNAMLQVSLLVTNKFLK